MSDDGDARPDLRWDPGARYRPSVLAARRPAPVSSGASLPTPPRLAGRLRRGPVRRTAVFDREVWRVDVRGARPGLADALAASAARYRRGALDTTGLVRAVGRALTS
ncbi:hypothetical protein GCM10009809_33900 [Isoptericola hypogeus]|uniref:Uncharacterized protein n=1 Tax=Isoptericola hypogeus TaxID=300179 RepID=A0ABP4VUF8_9MICO